MQSYAQKFNTLNKLTDAFSFTYNSNNTLKMSLFNFFKSTADRPANPSEPEVKDYILIVDDERFLNDLYTELLTSEGYTVVSAFNGKEALTLIYKNPPQLIILDIMMPIMNGNEVLAALHENNATKRIPVIVLTNDVNIENRANAKLYNAHRFFVKSNIDPSVIIEEVKEALKPKSLFE
jgi:CheY-like chemotaxis protein